MLAETCVFDKQSLEPIFCGLQQREPSEAPLIANLRGHFAEFLNHRSPERLRLLVSPTCVSFSTVTSASTLRSFSWTSFRSLPEHKCSRSSPLAYVGGFSYPTPPESPRTFLIVPLTLQTSSLHQVHFESAGMLTCCPSSTPFGLD